jgi:hypothetical protein
MGRMGVNLFEGVKALPSVRQAEVEKHNVKEDASEYFQAVRQPVDMRHIVSDPLGACQVLLDKERVIGIVLDEQRMNSPGFHSVQLVKKSRTIRVIINEMTGDAKRIMRYERDHPSLIRYFARPGSSRTSPPAMIMAPI